MRARGAGRLPAPPAASLRPALRARRRAGRGPGGGVRAPRSRAAEAVAVRREAEAGRRPAEALPSPRPNVLVLLHQILHPAPRRPLPERQLLPGSPGPPPRGLLAALSGRAGAAQERWLRRCRRGGPRRGESGRHVSGLLGLCWSCSRRCAGSIRSEQGACMRLFGGEGTKSRVREEGGVRK